MKVGDKYPSGLGYDYEVLGIGKELTYRTVEMVEDPTRGVSVNIRGTDHATTMKGFYERVGLGDEYGVSAK